MLWVCRATLEQLQFAGRWIKNTVTQSYLAKHPAVNMLAYALVGGWGNNYMEKHYNFRLDLEVRGPTTLPTATSKNGGFA